MLLKTIDELKRYVSIDSKRIPPSIALELAPAEARVGALLGDELRAWLQGQYELPDFDSLGSSLAAQLLQAVQRPLALFAVGEGITLHQVSIDETGVHIMTTETQKTAFQWQTREAQQQLLRRAYNALDALVDWLEAHRADSAELRAWASSAAGLRHRRELFTSTADFQEYENISCSRQVFQALKAVRRRVESGELRTVLGEDFLSELLEQVRTRALDPDNELLLASRVYPALASLTVGYAIPELGLRLSGDGIDLAVVRLDESNSKEAGLDQLLQQKASESYLLGERYLRQLRDFLDRSASATRFTTYFNSPAYTDLDKPAAEINTVDSKVYKFC